MSGLHCRSDANNDAGFTMITVAVLFSVVVVFSISLLNYSLTSRNAGKALRETISAAQIAEAGADKAIFCLNATSGANCGGTFGASHAGQTNVTYGTGKFTTTVTTAGSDKQITSTGTSASGRTSRIIVLATTVPQIDSPNFQYGLQSAAGGVYIENNPQISNMIHSNGDIICESTAGSMNNNIYSSKTGGKIDTCKISGQARADKILNSIISGDAYYKVDPTDVAGTSVSGTKYSNQTTPAVAPLPVLNLQFWRDAAEAGGTIVGNYWPSDNSSLGPVKITGNLNIGENNDLTITGPIWVMGNLNTYGNNNINLNVNFGSYGTVILVDNPADNVNSGKVNLYADTNIYGSGSPTSQLLIASTNTSTSDINEAISFGNSSIGSAFYAINGTLRMHYGSRAKALVGYRVYVDQFGTINYTASEFTGLFASRPPGTWRIKEGTWRQVR